jgi:hypothetical protein
VSEIRYGVGNLDVWQEMGIAMGFGTGGILILACLECGHQDIAEPGDRLRSIRVGVGMLEHVAQCPPRKKPAPPEGPTHAAIVDKGIYKFFTAPVETNNDAEQDYA